jgi:hypothetical protein
MASGGGELEHFAERAGNGVFARVFAIVFHCRGKGVQGALNKNAFNLV